MHKQIKRLLSLALVLVMLLGMLPTAFAAKTTVFSQDFNTDPSLTNWNQSTNDWTVAVPEGTATYLTHGGNCGAVITSAGESAWTDYTFSATLRYTDTSVSPGLLFRYQNDNNYYMFLYTPTEGEFRLYKRVNGAWSTGSGYAANVKKELAANTDHAFQITISGGNIICCVNGDEVLTYNDTSPLSAGKIGLRIVSGSNTGLAYVGNVSVINGADTLLSDSFADLSNWSSSYTGWKVAPAPDAKKDLTFRTPAAQTRYLISTGEASWTNYSYSATVRFTNKDVSPGLLARYQDANNFYMFMYDGISDTYKLYKRVGGSFTELTNKKEALAADTNHTFRMDVAGSSIKCYANGELKLEATDSTFAAGQVGLHMYYGNEPGQAWFNDPTVVAEQTIPSAPDPNPDPDKVETTGALFTEYFDSADTLDTNVWSGGQGGSFGLTAIEGDNWLSATSDGIISAGNTSWTNYQVAATVRLADGGQGGNANYRNAPGLLFRYQDASNFYMMMCSQFDQKVALYKRSGGTFTEIQKASYKFEANKDYQIKAHVYGNTITLYVDGGSVLQLTDDTFSSGKIGFRSYVNGVAGATGLLDNIVVTPTTEIGEFIIPGRLFTEEFGGDLAAWTAGEGSFVITNGAADPADTGVSTMTADNNTFSAYRLEADLTGTTGQQGLYAYGQYLAVIDRDANKASLYKADALLAEKDWRFDQETTLAISVKNGNVMVWANGSKLIDYTDTAALTNGKIGLYAKDTDGTFDNVIAKELGVADELPGDHVYAQAPEAAATAPSGTTADFYVAADGNDSWSGTLDRPNADKTDGPFATLQKASEAVAAAQAANADKDYLVLVRGGTYYLDSAWSLTQGGLNGHRVTYAAYPDEAPIISGGKEVDTQWTEYQNGIWKTTLPESYDSVEIRQLFVENARATRSREPDKADVHPNTDGWNVAAVDTTNYLWIRPDADIPESWANLTGVEMNSRGIWHYNRQAVASFDPATDTVTAQQYIGVQASGVKISNAESWGLHDWMCFENALLFVDTPGEWFYDETTRELYYYPENSADPNTLNVVIPTLETVVEVNGTKDTPVENVDMVGLSFRHTTWNMTDTIERRGIQGGFWGNERTDPVYAPPAAIQMTYTETSRFANCLFSMTGEGAIALGAGCEGNRIDNCEFIDVGANAIQVGYRHTYVGIGHPLEREWDDDTDAPAGNLICNNFFDTCCTVDQGGVAIWVGYANHTLIDHNTIQNMPYSGMNVGWRWSAGLTSSHHNTITRNYVYNTMITVADGGGIYCVGEQYGNKVLYNYVDKSLGTGFYFDEMSNYTEGAYNHATNITHSWWNLNRNGTENDFHDNYNSAPADPSQFGCAAGYGVSGDKFALNVNLLPAEATMTVTGTASATLTGFDAYQLPAGEYSYSVELAGYTTQNGTFTITDSPVDLDVTLIAVGASDAEIADAAKATVENANFNTVQSVANDEAAVKAVIEAKLSELNLNGATVESITVSVTPAVAGTAGDTDGTNGSFTATVVLKKGEATATAEINGTITATTYVAPSTPSVPGHIHTPIIPVIPEEELPFVDVVESDWFYDEVKDAWKNDLIDGASPTEYRPYNYLTVSQAIKLAAALHQMDNLGKVTLTNGTPNWYDSYVDYAVANGVIEAKYLDYTVAQMNAPVTRREFVHIFFGAMPVPSYTVINIVADNAIPDVKMGDQCADEIYTFYRAGILTGGKADGSFLPGSNIKRSEVAAILIRMYDKTARQSISLN